MCHWCHQLAQYRGEIAVKQKSQVSVGGCKYFWSVNVLSGSHHYCFTLRCLPESLATSFVRFRMPDLGLAPAAFGVPAWFVLGLVGPGGGQEETLPSLIRLRRVLPDHRSSNSMHMCKGFCVWVCWCWCWCCVVVVWLDLKGHGPLS